METVSADWAVLRVTDLDLRPFSCAITVLVHADVHRGLGPARTGIADLFDLIRDAQEQLGRREGISQEVSTQAEAHDRYVVQVSRQVDVPDVFLRQELALVDKHGTDSLTRLDAELAHLGLEVGPRVEAVRGALSAETRRHKSLAEAIIDNGGPQTNLAVVAVVVVRDLQDARGLTRIHRGEVEIDLGHGDLS